MSRTRIQLTEEQAKAVKRLAGERGVSMAEVLRQGVDLLLAETGRSRDWDRARSVVGKYRSGGTGTRRKITIGASTRSSGLDGLVDTSALYALLDESDESHSSAAATFESLPDQDLTTPITWCWSPWRWSTVGSGLGRFAT